MKSRKGPVNKPILINSMDQFESIFGKPDKISKDLLDFVSSGSTHIVDIEEYDEYEDWDEDV